MWIFAEAFYVKTQVLCCGIHFGISYLPFFFCFFFGGGGVGLHFYFNFQLVLNNKKLILCSTIKKKIPLLVIYKSLEFVSLACLKPPCLFELQFAVQRLTFTEFFNHNFLGEARFASKFPIFMNYNALCWAISFSYWLDIHYILILSGLR